MVLSVLILASLAAHAQGSPFDTGFNAIQSLFTGTIAKVASLVAIVIGGYDSPTRIGSVKEGRPANGRPLPGRPSLLQPGPGSGEAAQGRGKEGLRVRAGASGQASKHV